jgi:putative transposase
VEVGYESICDSFRCSVHAAMILTNLLHTQNFRYVHCYDNAVAESFFSSLKNELIHHNSFRTRGEARTAIFEYIEVFYNRQRRHQTLDYCSPVDYERKAGVY